MGEDVPLHDPYKRVATGAICLQVHEVPLEAGRPALQDRPAFLEELFGVNGLQMLWVRGLQILRVLGGGAAVQGLGESAIESARAVSHGTGCREGKENNYTLGSFSCLSSLSTRLSWRGQLLLSTETETLMQGNAVTSTGRLKAFPGSTFPLGQVTANTIKIGLSALR